MIAFTTTLNIVSTAFAVPSEVVLARCSSNFGETR
jgi:hypothetical protein